MAFSKSFPRTLKGSSYPLWEEISLTDQEEKEIEFKAKEENIKLMDGCLDQAKKILNNKELNEYQSDIVALAIALFDKIGSHQVYHKESKAKEKFDKRFKTEDR